MAKYSILRRPAVEDQTGLSRSNLYLLIKRDQFPKPIKLSERSVGWLKLEVDDWLAKKIKDRDAEVECSV